MIQQPEGGRSGKQSDEGKIDLDPHVVSLAPLENELLALARTAARGAAELLLAGQQEAATVQTKSSATDIVTQMDIAAEDHIVATILASRPADAVIGEEAGYREGRSGITWVIDPLDGTVNYLYQLPAWAVSIAAQFDGGSLAAVVVLPGLGEEYTATATGPALRRCWPQADEPLVLSGPPEPPDLSAALIATGFGYRPRRRANQARVLADLLPRIRDIRRGGAAAVDLCWLAAGRFDAYFERGLQPWDHAGAGLICRRAGLVVSGGSQVEPNDSMCIAGPAPLHRQLQAALAELDAERAD